MTWLQRLRLALPALLFSTALSGCSGEGAGAGFVNRSPEDYCTLSDRSTLFLIDRTTRFDEDDQRVLMDSLGHAVDRLDTGDRIIIATISDHYSKTRGLANACKPGCPEATGIIGEIAGSCSTMKAKQDEQAFMAGLAASLREIIGTAEDAPGSDIIRTIGHWTGSNSADPYTSIIIYSDMLENSEMISWRDFSALPDESLISIVEEHAAIAKLSAANVQVIGYGRFHDADRSPLPAATDRKVRSFWSLYFGQSQSSLEFAASIE